MFQWIKTAAGAVAGLVRKINAAKLLEDAFNLASVLYEVTPPMWTGLLQFIEGAEKLKMPGAHKALKVQEQFSNEFGELASDSVLRDAVQLAFRVLERIGRVNTNKQETQAQ